MATKYAEEAASGLSYASAAVITQLNERWRVRDDPLQWILERRTGDQWQSRSFCRTKAGLLRCVREYCSAVDAVAALTLRVLPDRHVDWEAR
jgi:hypothetical protein